MAEITKIYGPASGEASSSASKSAKAQPPPEKKKAKRPQQDAQPSFESGFDHGFEQMATFNGRAIGKDEAAASSSTSAVDSRPTATQASGNKQASTNFDFNFEDAPKQPAAAFDLDDLLTGGA